MTGIPSGLYGITNRQLSSDNQPLFVNSSGVGQILTVTGPAGYTTWNIGTPDLNGMQTISDSANPTLYVGLDDNNNLVTAPFDSPPTWSIRMSRGVFTIQDSFLNGFWVLRDPTIGQSVDYDIGTGTTKENWVLYRFQSATAVQSG